MQNLISTLSIRTRIFAGFILITCFIVVISVIAYKGIGKTDKGFTSYVSINEKSQYILPIDNNIVNLQRSVSDYIYTGYEAIAEKVIYDLNDLNSTLLQQERNFKDDKESIEYIRRMKNRLDSYKQTFKFSIEERRKRKVLIEDIKNLKIQLLSSEEFPPDFKLILVEAENKLFEYLDDPDIKKTDQAIKNLDKYIKNIKSDLIKEKLTQYKTKYIEVIQSTRGFLFLLSVVMAGEAQEFRYITTKFKELVLSQNEPIKMSFRNQITETRNIITFSSVILLFLAILFSIIISNSINRPLYDLTETFNKLANDEFVSSIPGQNFRDEIGQMSRAAEVFRKNNESTKELLIVLDKQKRDLEKSNIELEQFAYIASHDLQEPLRTVSSFTQLLAKRYKDKLDEEANEYIDYAVNGAKRMQSLIQGLLLISRIDSKQEPFAKVEANALYDFSVKDLAKSIADTGTKISRDELPVVFGDVIQLKQLFQNLMGNAVKYYDPNKQNEVHCSVIENDECWTFSIKDSGIGIKAEYFDQIFVIFKRLHTKDEYSGTGIGLALCKKIVERHGGKIWIESTPAVGTTFLFTLPKSKIL